MAKIGFDDGQVQLRKGVETKTGMILIRPGDLVVSGINAAKGAIAVYGDSSSEAIAATIHYGTYIPNSQRVDVRYLWWLLRSTVFRELLLLYVPGGIKTELKASRLLPIAVPLPPLDEQRRIVARIEELAARIEEARGLRRETIEESSAFLSSEAGRIVANVAARFEVRSLGSYNPHVTSGPRYWNSRYSNTGFRFYRAQDIGSKGEILNDSKVYVVPPDSQQGQSALLAVGDLMLVITGATVGRCTVFPDDLEPGYVSQHVAICRLPSTEVLPAFALWCLRAPQGQTQLLGQRYGQGKPGLNLSNIRALKLPIPPLLEQHRIVVYLDDLQARVDALKRLQAETAAELDALLPSVLDKAFRGEL